MNTLRMCEIEVQRKISRDLLLKLYVRGVDSWVSVVLAERPNAAEAGERISNRTSGCETVDRRAGTGSRRHQTRPGGTYEWVCKQAAGDRLLLHAVSGNRTHLRQHVLPRIVNAVATSQDRFTILRSVPGKAYSRLKLFLRAVQRAVRWESRIAQGESVSGG